MGFYPTSGVQTRRAVDMSEIMRSVYLWLTLGLAVAFGIAVFVSNSAQAVVSSVPAGLTSAQAASYLSRNSILFNPAVQIGSLIAYIVLALALHPVIMRAQPAVGAAMYLLVTAVFGFMLASILLRYNLVAPRAAPMAFVTTAGMFGAMTAVGLVTKIDLSKMGSILLMALFGLIIASVINWFAQSSTLDYLISYAGVVIFAGLTAYDTQWIRNTAEQVADRGDADMGQRVALVGAFHLFLDFVNLFLYLLRIFGRRR